MSKPRWFARANLCGHDLVAVSICHRDRLNVNASLVADDDNEAVECGDRWQPLVVKVATTMAQRTGKPISTELSCCWIMDDGSIDRREFRRLLQFAAR